MTIRVEYSRTEADWYPAASVANIIGYKWSIPIIYTLSENGKMGFNDLRNDIKVSAKMLNETLEVLIYAGMVYREESGNHVSYGLKVKPKKLIAELENMNREI